MGYVSEDLIKINLVDGGVGRARREEKLVVGGNAR
jgi:hypothetical protein